MKSKQLFLIKVMFAGFSFLAGCSGTPQNLRQSLTVRINPASANGEGADTTGVTFTAELYIPATGLLVQRGAWQARAPSIQQHFWPMERYSS